MHEMKPYLEKSTFPALARGQLETLQMNLGYLCNLSCLHCHVNAGPTRKELMSKQTIDQALSFVVHQGINTLDLTGGAPEMNPHFRYLVEQATTLGINVIDRCNLVILNETGYEDLAEFLVQNKVNIVASLPCYLEDNVDSQRGNGVYQKSIVALKQLNDLGYGKADSGLKLDLVFNPQDASLPPPQKALETSYKTYLREQYNIVFNQLFTITNMPIKRFGSTLISKGTFADYMSLLENSYNSGTLDQLMCISAVSIDWQGYVYDCDFNQMLDLPYGDYPAAVHISDISNNAITIMGEKIATRQHCYGCTAGQGSSCGGALS